MVSIQIHTLSGGACWSKHVQTRYNIWRWWPNYAGGNSAIKYCLIVYKWTNTWWRQRSYIHRVKHYHWDHGVSQLLKKSQLLLHISSKRQDYLFKLISLARGDSNSSYLIITWSSSPAMISFKSILALQMVYTPPHKDFILACYPLLVLTI
jgi:hypothetical protein